MSNNMQATAAQKRAGEMSVQALLAPEARQLEHKWRSWTRSAISCAKKRQAERGIAVTMTSDGLMAKLRAASFRCVLSGEEFRNDGGGRTIPTVERIDPDGPYSDDNTRVVCLGVNALRDRGSMDDM